MYVIVAPGGVSGEGEALSNLAYREKEMYAKNMVYCSPHQFLPGGGDPWNPLQWCNEVINQGIAQSVWRLHCPECSLAGAFSFPKLRHFGSMLPSPHYCGVNRDHDHPER